MPMGWCFWLCVIHAPALTSGVLLSKREQQAVPVAANHYDFVGQGYCAAGLLAGGSAADVFTAEWHQDWCKNGNRREDKCCAKSCGGCGGPACNKMPGGPNNCCMGLI